jgi:hypothetical protein
MSAFANAKPYSLNNAENAASIMQIARPHIGAFTGTTTPDGSKSFKTLGVITSVLRMWSFAGLG